MPKGTSRAAVMSNSEQIKPIAVAIIELRLSEGISQLLSQSVENFIKFFLFCSNLLNAFRINLKAYLGLVLPTNTASGKIEAGSVGMLFCGPHILLCGTYCTSSSSYDLNLIRYHRHKM